MPKQLPEKCRLCAKLTAEQAKARHGCEGDGCWDPGKCHQRRYWARNRERINQARNQKRWQQEGRIPQQPIQLEAPPVVSGVLVLYRVNTSAPIHAMGAEIWQGNRKLATVQPVHCFGLSASQVKDFIREMILALGRSYGITKFASQVELHPQQCPLDLCPYKDESVMRP